jgi:hypothetical protein
MGGAEMGVWVIWLRSDGPGKQHSVLNPCLGFLRPITNTIRAGFGETISDPGSVPDASRRWGGRCRGSARDIKPSQGGCLSPLSTHPLTQNHYAMTIAKYTVSEPLLDLNMDLGEGCVWVCPSLAPMGVQGSDGRTRGASASTLWTSI